MKIEPKTQLELERNFVEAFERLVRANGGYDEGRLSEAPNIAKEIHSLVDKTKNRSLLKNVGHGAIDFLSSAQPQYPGNLMPEYRLIHATIGFDGMDYRPFLDNAEHRALLTFEEWDQEAVLARHGHESIYRGELIEFIRHVEGGAHVAPRYEQRWSGKLLGLMRGDFVDGHMILNSGPPIEPANPHAPAYATVRQIGWEMEQTLRQSCHELVARADFNPRPGPRMRPVQ